jgi:predicted permease
MKKSGILIVLAALLLVLNLADVVSTWIALSSGRGIEANPFILFLGGPFTPIAFTLKLVVVPAAMLGVAWYMARRFKDPRLGMATLIAPAAMYAAVVANNVVVAAKKVEKTAKKAVKNAKQG